MPDEIHSQILDYSGLNSMTNSESMHKLLKYSDMYYNKTNGDMNGLVTMNDSIWDHLLL